MAPTRSNARQNDQNRNVDNGANANLDELFIEPMMGTPLAMYIEKDVENRDLLVELITKHGGSVSPGYSGVPYILVDPHKESGQSLYRQYAGKKGKIVLNARWVQECVRLGELQTFHSNWAGCKVTGHEQVGIPPAPQPPPAPTPARGAQQARKGRQSARTQAVAGPSGVQHGQVPQSIPQPTSLQAPPPQAPAPAPLPPPAPQTPTFTYPVYQQPQQQQQPPQPQSQPPVPRPSPMQPPTTAPPQTWQAAGGIAPHQTHISHAHQAPQLIPQPANVYAPREDQRWNGAFQPVQPVHPQDNNAHMGTAINGQNANGFYDARAWADGAQDYYDQTQYEPYQPPPPPPETTAYIPIAGPSNAPSVPEVTPPQSISGPPERPRGRKRTRTQPQPAPPASTLVLNRRQPPARSPTPPTRIIKSTYGGNLFTADDVMYLKKYIDYCQDQGLVLSLREICERIAIKAPHHTFYSWRRYCNKHQIRLGGYAMDTGSQSPPPDEEQQFEAPRVVPPPPPPPSLATVEAAQRSLREEAMRTRSPTPPRSLFRSTTGKGVAFTDEDVTFLVKFLAFRRSQGRIDMVSFWKDVAAKAPHHSRASWMKYYRRHKHELNRVDGDDPLPAPPEKKLRYGKDDDILLAKYFANKPEGTSDKVFQAFAVVYPHHPWKGWQEHHRVHRAKIDYLIQKIHNGESIDDHEAEQPEQ